MNVSEFAALIARHEGKELKMYTDTVGVPTIGYGHNLQEGISERAAMVILEDDIEIVLDELDKNMSWWRMLPEPAMHVVASMVFNLGWPRFSGFKKFIMALEDGDYERAAFEMEDSLWYRQIKTRGPELKQMMLDSI